jgi:DNA-binding transcriptional MerR regulator
MTATNARQMDMEVEEQVAETPASEEVKKSPSAFRTISEVADELGVQQHVLRFWETKFTQIKPLKRGGGRRYYRPEDVLLLKRIHNLLYSEGYTIKGVQKLLKGQGKQQIAQQHTATAANTFSETPAAPVQASASVPTQSSVPQQRGLTGKQKAVLEEMLHELREMRELIKVGEAS